jgi:hypothetical protein
MSVVALILWISLAAQQPVPQPFPRPGTPSRPAPPPTQPAPAPSAPKPAAPVAVAPAAEAAPDEATLGVTLYPNSQFIRSYDAGRGQRFYLYGSTASFVELVAYYRTLLKTRGELLFETPPTHQFDLGRFREETMAFPPSVTIKDFRSETSAGYPNPKPGGTPERFPTIVQVVPNPPGNPR